MLKHLTLSIFALIVLAGCVRVQHKGIIIDKVYTPSTSGTGISSSGKLVFVNTPQTFTMVLKMPDGSIETKKVNSEVYYHSDKGDYLTFSTVEFK